MAPLNFSLQITLKATLNHVHLSNYARTIFSNSFLHKQPLTPARYTPLRDQAVDRGSNFISAGTKSIV